jgi:hypothetical protein
MKAILLCAAVLAGAVLNVSCCSSDNDLVTQAFSASAGLNDDPKIYESCPERPAQTVLTATTTEITAK